jgi:hypothetical protein
VETPSEDDMYWTIGHPLLDDKTYGSVDYHPQWRWVASVWVSGRKQDFDHLESSTEAKLKAEQALAAAGVVILFPTEP